ncbi:MAG: DUF6268 family outer membrane beta-barrel protein [Pseudomonadales bacterium]
MLYNKNKIIPAPLIFFVIMCSLSYCPDLLLANEYHYEETGKADSTSSHDKLTIIKNDLAVALPAPLQFNPDAILSWQHSYTQLKQDIATPLHNGHLHQSRIHWKTSEHRVSLWQHEWSLGLAMSSNRFRNIKPDQDGLVLEGSTFRVFQLSKTFSSTAGIQANYLFNRYRILPDFGIRWQSTLGNVAISTQRFSWNHDLSARRRITVIIARTGSKWFAQDNDSGVKSEIYLRKNIANLGYQFKISPDWDIRFGLGYTQVRRLKFQNAFNGPVTLKFDRSPGFGLALIGFQS